mmetsp:Transcript_72061/g.120002  ORF Transcript_72061/g.120002 Transcript_72061/m.120002 type:complete len:371 (+) Transcript_72061:97-1209(+)
MIAHIVLITLGFYTAKEEKECWTPLEGPIGSVTPSTRGRPHLIMGMDIDYPPYAYLNEEPYETKADVDSVVGVGADMLHAMAKMCDFDVTITQAHWADCWGAGEIGQGLKEGWYHGCMTYTHAAGVRNRYMEFSNSWAILNKPSGLIAKLVEGKPAVKGDDNLDGKTIVDVTGWAPTADTLYFVKNQCTDAKYEGFTVVQGDDIDLGASASKAKGPNDRALLAVLDGHADAMWIYGDQAANYQCNDGETQDGYSCELWSGFGETFAYVQSGMFGWMYNGTTVSLSKKGSGVAKILDECLEKFLPSKEFHDVCKIEHHNHNQLSTCIPNKHFHDDPDYHPADPEHSPFMFPTKDLGKGGHSCSTGYCTCSE